MIQDERISLFRGLFLPLTIRRAAKVGLIVGTLLVTLNHGDNILAGEWPAWWKIILTFLVPYSVSSYSTAAFIREYQSSLRFVGSSGSNT